MAESGDDLPNPRLVSSGVFTNENKPSSLFSHMAMIYGQFLDHDITLATHPPNIECPKDCTHTGECFGIPIPDGDHVFRDRDVTCIEVIRSLPSCDGNYDNTREQVNTITAYIDASNVYGSDAITANSLRREDGLIAEVPNPKCGFQSFLTPADPNTFCQNPKNKPCVRAGDERVNENVGR